jgi:hypothetical protein
MKDENNFFAFFNNDLMWMMYTYTLLIFNIQDHFGDIASFRGAYAYLQVMCVP